MKKNCSLSMMNPISRVKGFLRTLLSADPAMAQAALYNRST